MLKIAVSSVLPEGRLVDAEAPAEMLSPKSEHHIRTGPVRVSGKLMDVGERYLFNGAISGSYRCRCDRCLCETEVPFQTDVTWFFVPGQPRHPLEDATEKPDEAPDENQGGESVFVFSGTAIDLGIGASEEIVIGYPTKAVCSETCAGLCPQCGVNLNTETCACNASHEPEQTKGRGFEGLAEMFPDLEPDSLEE